MVNTRNKGADGDGEEEEEDVGQQLKGMRRTIEYLSDQIKESNKVNKEMMKLLKENDALKSKVQNLENRVNLLEQDNIKSNVIIHGTEVQSNESITEVVLKVAQGMHSTITKEQIVECYRKPAKDANKHPPILVKFANTKVKREFLEKRKEVRSLKARECALKGENREIYINEQLTDYNSKLFYEARQIKKNNKCKWVWTKEGKIFARKDDNSELIRIIRDEDLKKLQ